MSTITSIEFEGFYYIETSDGIIAKGCRRCGGTGHYSFNGYDSICYLCNNHFESRIGDIFETRQQAEKWCHERAVRKAQADRKREAVRLAKIAKRDAAWQALKDQHPAAWDLVSSVLHVVIPFESGEFTVDYVSTERDSFVLKLADQLWTLDERPYSARQIEVLEQKAAQRTERKVEAEAHPAPEGRVVVTGEIVSAKAKESDFGVAYKILVNDDAGFKVWCSLPKAQADQAIEAFEDSEHWAPYTFGSAVWFLGLENDDRFPGVKGRRITFTAALEPSKDDVSFAFGSRPTKGAWL